MKFIKAIPFLLSYLKIKNIFLSLIQLLLKPSVLLSIWIIWCCLKLWHDYPRWKEVCVVKVKDGDTFDYTSGDGLNVFTARLWHIDAFEKDQIFWGEMSYKKLKSLLNFKEEHIYESRCVNAFIKEFKKDMYGRSLVIVKKNISDTMTTNEQLVKLGMALVYPQGEWPLKDKSYWMNLQDLAKVGKNGVWSAPQNSWQKPWNFRKKNKIKKSISVQTAHYKHFY